MAKEIQYTDFSKQTNVLNAFYRSDAIPLDKTNWFESMADAKKYAAGNEEDPDSRELCFLSYAGQTIAVKTGTDTNKNGIYKSYIIQGDGTLSEVGGVQFKLSSTGDLQYSQDSGKSWTNIELPSGSIGIQGVTGLQGATGPKGANGAQGITGPKGTNGAQGVTGPQGPKGDNGADGTGVTIKDSRANCKAVGDGYIDENGHLQMLTTLPSTFTDCGEIKGPQGVTGVKGAQGATGPKGDKGDQGNPGERGATGLQGVTGPKGADGKNGTNGAQGATGPKGDKGDQGNPGSTGAQGVTGPKGANGNPGSQGVTGLQGIRGTRTYYGGDTAFANTELDTIQIKNPSISFLVGDFYCYTANNDWTVWSCDDIDGTQYTFTNRGSLRGADGKNGTNGAQGATGPKGANGAQGATGPQGPKGDKGADGTGVTIKASKSECKSVGDGYVDENGHLQMLTTLPSTFTDCGEIKGPQGVTGVKGVQGVTGPAGKDGSDADATYDPADTTLSTMQLGGIPANTKASALKGKTVSDLFDMLLFPTYCPAFIDAKLTASLTSTALVEIGGTLPTASYSASKAYTQTSSEGANRVYGGEATVTQTAGANNSSSTVGTKTWTYRANFAQGTDLIKDSKGNNTNQTASNYTTLLGGGVTDKAANIGGTGPAKYVITARNDKTAAVSCTVVYPYYAPNASGAETKQALTNNTSFIIENYSATNAKTQVFCSVPSSFTDVSITQANVSGAYPTENAKTIANGELIVGTTSTKTFGSVSVAYTTYRLKTTDLAGVTNYQVKFTKA